MTPKANAWGISNIMRSARREGKAVVTETVFHMRWEVNQDFLCWKMSKEKCIKIIIVINATKLTFVG